MQGGMRPLRTATLMVVLVSMVAAPALAAGEPTPSVVTARAPVVVDGRGDASLEGDGLLLLLGDGSERLLSLRVSAPEMRVSHWRTETDCVLSTSQCFPTFAPETTWGSPSQEFTVRNVTVTTEGAIRDDFRAAFSLREDARRMTDGLPPTLRLDHSSGTVAELTAGKREGWDGPAPEGEQYYSPSGPSASYHSRSDDFLYRVADADASTLGHFSTYLNGVDVRIRGTDARGQPFDETYKTGVTTRESGTGERRTYESLVIETPDGDARVVYEGEVVLAGMPNVTSYDTLVLNEARGEAVLGSERRSFEGETATLLGDVSITPVEFERTRESNGYRVDVVLQIADPSAVPPFTDPAVTPLQRVAGDVGSSPVAGAAAGALTFGTLALVGAVAYYWPYVRYGLTGFLMPLYSRIERDDVLDHGKREEIYDLIRDAPGIHAHEISSRVGIGWGTTVYHLRLLEGHRLVVSKRAGRYKRFFLISGAAGARKDAYGVLRNDTTARVGHLVLKNPGVAQKDVCQALGISPSLVSWHVDRLEEADLVKKVKDGRRVRYYAGPAWNDLNLAVVPILAHATAETVQVAVADGGPADN